MWLTPFLFENLFTNDDSTNVRFFQNQVLRFTHSATQTFAD